jgi:hypothetical protein
MGLYEGRGQIGKMMKDLSNRWHETRLNWDDEQARRFEEKFIEPMEMDARNAISAMDEMASLLTQIKQECE